MKVQQFEFWRLSGAMSRGRRQSHSKFFSEESPKVTRKFLLSILAVIPAVFLPLTATSQIAPDRPHKEQAEPTFKYEVYAGYGYTSLNQVNQSRYGLQGANFSVTRDWGKYFGLTADGAFYNYATSQGNPGSPKVDLVLLGPVLHAQLIGRTSGFFHVLLGGAHTGGESMTPNISFAGGVGGGLEYQLKPRIFIRASGDDIASSFVSDPNHLGYSPHERRNSRATLGVVYKF
jgi:hypothetical protein